ncbi:MAG: DNA repair ATPase [Pacificimonas sp.]
MAQRDQHIVKKSFRIGTGNAETDDDYLFDCFIENDAMAEATRVGSAGMILSARTGAGKTAIIRMIRHRYELHSEIDPARMAMDYVTNSDALSFVQTIGGDLNLLFQVLWKHVICIEFVRLKYHIADEQKSRNIFQNIYARFKNDPRRKRSLNYLQRWENKFWITMDENVKEITKQYEKDIAAEFGAELDNFKAGGQYQKRLSEGRKIELVTRFKKIVNAQQLSDLSGVIDILSEDSEGEQPEFILIDKLDENWVDTSIRFKLIRALIESLRVFRNIRNLKLLVALRSDVLERVVQETQDVSFQREKFDQYNIEIDWSSSELFDLIDQRISLLFKRKYTNESVRFYDIFPPKIGGKDTFSYMLERTLMRPRDIISYVNEAIKKGAGRTELIPANVTKAAGPYSTIRRNAIEQEWLSAYPSLYNIIEMVKQFKKKSIKLRELRASDHLDNLALEIAANEKVDYDPLFAHAIRAVDGAGPDQFSSEIVLILYRVGCVGVRFTDEHDLMYSHKDEPVISAGSLSDESAMRFHPMMVEALKLGPSQTPK